MTEPIDFDHPITLCADETVKAGERGRRRIRRVEDELYGLYAWENGQWVRNDILSATNWADLRSNGADGYETEWVLDAPVIMMVRLSATRHTAWRNRWRYLRPRRKP